MEKLFESTRKTFYLLMGIIILIVLFMLLGVKIFRNNIYSCFSDDFAQYLVILQEFVMRLKSGSLSFYSFFNYTGASFFSETYYIPIDIFSLFTAVLSNFMSFSLAFSLTEMLKLVLGVASIFFYLKLKNYSNKVSLVTSLLYMVTGAYVVLMAFPTYFSLIVYVPLAAIVIHFFRKGNYLILPLFVFYLVFYDFYIAYTLIWFMGLYLVITLIIDKAPLKKALIEILEFVGLGILGVIMSSVILIPSATFILNESARADGMSGGILSIFASPSVHASKFIDKFLYSYVNLKASFKSFFVFENFFAGKVQYDFYFRLISKIFVPIFPSSFWGLSNSYVTQHLSLYITVSGLLVILSVFYLRDRTSNVMKICLGLELIFLMLPFVYMLFSGSSEPYTRWFVMLNFFNIMCFAHVFEKTNLEFYDHRKHDLIRNSILAVILLVTVNYFLMRIFNKNIFTFVVALFKHNLTYDKNFRQIKFLKIDIIMMLGSAALLMLISGLNFVKKVNFAPYFVLAEVLVGLCFMFAIPIVSSNIDKKLNTRNEYNEYLDEFFPYDRTFYRILSVGGDSAIMRGNSNRTNEQFTNLYTFHSFYQDNVGELTNIIYGTDETARVKEYADIANPYNNALFGVKYLVAPKSNYKNFLGVYQETAQRNSKYYASELEGAYPFIVYDSQIPVKDGASNLIDSSFNTLEKQVYMLNALYTSIDLGLKEKNYSYNVSNLYYSGSKQTIDGVSYMVFDIDFDSDKIADTGMFYFRNKQTTDVFLGIKKDNTLNKVSSCTKNICYYSDVESGTKLYIEDGTASSYNFYFDDFSAYYDYEASQSYYGNQSLIVRNDGFSLSFDRTNTEDKVIVSIPFSYSPNFKVNNKKYSLVNVNGGMLGLVVPAGEEKIDVLLTYVPDNLSMSALVSFSGFMTYALFLTYRIIIKKDYITKVE